MLNDERRAGGRDGAGGGAERVAEVNARADEFGAVVLTGEGERGARFEWAKRMGNDRRADAQGERSRRVAT